MKAVLVLNGEPPSLARLNHLGGEFPVYAADGGAMVCMAAGIKPEWVAGDFDSQRIKALPPDWQIHLLPEQDRTDFQKVLSLLPNEIDELLILGGLGRRMDHFLTNLIISMELAESVRVVFEGERQEIYRITPTTSFEMELEVGIIFSLIPLNRVRGVSTSGLKWNLSETDMGPGLQLGQSNQVDQPAVKIRIREGCLFAWKGGQLSGETGLF